MAKTMTTTDVPITHLEAIQRQINRAERDLVEQRTQLDDDGMAVLFTGNHHDAFPRHLIVNDKLSPAEKMTWQVIRLSITDPSRPGSTPRRDDIAAMVNCSPPTVTSCRTMLRIRGWITYCRSVRSGGRFVGDIFLLNDEPLSLQSTLEIDSSFVPFLESQLQSNNKRFKQAAADVLREIERMATGTPPSEIEQMGVRLERARENPAHRSKFFAPVNQVQNGQDLTDPLASSEESSGLDDQRKNFAPVENDDETHRRKNFAAVSKKLSPIEQKISCSPGSSSSFNINNKYINTARVHARDDQSGEISASSRAVNQAETESLANYHELQRMGRWGLDEDQEAAWLKRYLPWFAYQPFALYTAMLTAGRANVLPVIWRKLKTLPKHSQELVALQLLGNVAAWHHGWRTEPIRDPIGYLHRLVELQLSNTLYPDEWSLELKRCWDEQGSPVFVNSPERMAWLRASGLVEG